MFILNMLNIIVIIVMQPEMTVMFSLDIEIGPKNMSKLQIIDGRTPV